MMKTIGLLGGMSWESTADYYRLINQGIREKCGSFHSAPLILNSVDFAQIEELQRKGDWQIMGEILAEAALNVERAGADFLLICTNTMHKVAEEIEAAISIPLLHIGDATGKVLQDKGISTVGLLGTAFTMEQEFYRGRLENRYAMDVVIPEESDRKIVHEVIFNELCLGKHLEQSRQNYLRIINTLTARGAEAVILGCTEIGMLVKQSDSKVHLLDTTMLHAQQAVAMALEEEESYTS